jgi:pyridoxamine 5'-phosphate oxidase
MDWRTAREQFEHEGLDVDQVDPNPFVQVERWIDHWASVDTTNDPGAVILATAGADGHATARTVLLRGLDERGFTIFTSYDSRKGQDLDAVPYGTILATWVPIHRQVNARGPIAKIDRAESEAYWATRPRGSQLAAWSSHQSSVLADRAELEARFAEVEARFGDGAIPCPPFWGGYRLTPESIELWQGQPNRMHDRVRYERDADAPTGWRLVRLSP